ncbi:MAG: aminotransferase class IV [Deltaproteobacteria bacterium]|jgi:branched-chain amino acid aminotransferase|nr:aminotransferase class IV [Deltaproteobacteria bacterium]
MHNFPVYSPEKLTEILLANKKSWHDNYLVMFSSIWGGFSTFPPLWGVPPDDHMVHRADAVFESFKCLDGKAYCLEEHLERLKASAQALSLTFPSCFDNIRDILRQAYHLGNCKDITVRLTISRGPGSFTVSPYDSKGPALYLVTMKFMPAAPELYERGISLATSPFPAKSEYAGVKSCDYLHNVLAKKTALDAGADYVVSFDQEGFLTEGATENVAVITKDKRLVVPSFKRILKGVTLLRIMDLAQNLVAQGELKSVVNQDMTKPQIQEEIEEAFITTTSFDVLGVYRWDDRLIGQGRPGPITKKIRQLIQEEQNRGLKSFDLN